MHESKISEMHKSKDAEINGIVSRLKEKYQKKVSHTSGITLLLNHPFPRLIFYVLVSDWQFGAASYSTAQPK